ncbi:hypothetical protein EIP86_005166 [Pleurotus ostreatoroseus]|nr:hypothetical protein EIP86_005166 [Pleurotus ostreatoroseus]
MEQEQAAMILVEMKRQGERNLARGLDCPTPVGRTIYNAYPVTRDESLAARVEIPPQISTSRSVGTATVDEIVEEIDWDGPPSLWRTPVEISTQYPVSSVRDTPGPGALPMPSSRLAPTTDRSRAESENFPRRSSWAGTSTTRMPATASQDEVSSLASLRPIPALRSGTGSALSPSPMPCSRGATEVTAATTPPHSPAPPLIPAPKPAPATVPAPRPAHAPNPAPIPASRPTPTPKPVKTTSAAPVRKPPMASLATPSAPSYAPETILAPRPIAVTSSVALGSSSASSTSLPASTPQASAVRSSSTSGSRMRSLASVLSEESDLPPAYPPPLTTATEAVTAAIAAAEAASTSRRASQFPSSSSPAVASESEPVSQPTATLTQAPDHALGRAPQAQAVSASNSAPTSASRRTLQSPDSSGPAVASAPRRTRQPAAPPTGAPDAGPRRAPQPVPATKPTPVSASQRTSRPSGSSSPAVASTPQRARRLPAKPTRAAGAVPVRAPQPAPTSNPAPTAAPQPTPAGPTLRSTASTPNLRWSAVPIPEMPLPEDSRPRSAIPQIPLLVPPGYPSLAMPPLPPTIAQALRGIPSIFGAMGGPWFGDQPMPPNTPLPMQGQRMMNAPIVYHVPPMPQSNPGTAGVQNVAPAAQTQPPQPQSRKGKQRAQEPPIQQPAQKPEKAQQPDARQQADKQTADKRKKSHKQKAQRQAAQQATQAEAGRQFGQAPSGSGHAQPQPPQLIQAPAPARQAQPRPIQDQGQPTQNRPARPQPQPTGPQTAQPSHSRHHQAEFPLGHGQGTLSDHNAAAQSHSNQSRVPQQQQRTRVHVVEYNVYVTPEQWAAMQAQTRAHQQTASQQADQWRGWAESQFTQRQQPRQQQAQAGMSNQTIRGVDTTGSQNEDTSGAGPSNASGSTRRQRTQSSDQPTGQSPPQYEISMVLPHDLCSHLQNAFRSRHQRVSVPHTRQNLGILTILLRAGFISNITRGTISQPNPQDFYAVGDAQRRIWADLKYRDDRPVLNHMSLISKPSKAIKMDLSEIRRLCTGRRAQTVKPLGMGEIAVVKTTNKDNEWLEAREALELGLAGEVICRAR